MLRPTRITRYVFSEVMTPTLLGLMLYTFVLLMNHFFFVAEKALSKNLGAELTFRLFLSGIPAILILSIPMAVLLGCLIAVGRLSSDNEWVALQGAGQGPSKLFKPMLLFGVLASLVSLYIYAELVPRANYSRRYLSGQILLSSSLASDLKPRMFYSELHDVVLYVEDIVPVAEAEEGRLRGVLLIRSNPQRNSYELIRARTGDLYPATDRSGTLVADLFDGVMHRFELDDPDTYYLADFESKREPIPPPPYLEGLLAPPDKVVSDMSTREVIAELNEARRSQREVIDRLVKEGRDPKSRQDRFIVDNRVTVNTVELSSRFALPATSLFFSALAVPLGIRRARSGKGAGFAISLIVILIYWVVFTVTRDQAMLGKIPAWIGPWVANLAMVPFAAVGLWRLRRPRDSGSGPLVLAVVQIKRCGRWLNRLFSRRGRRQAGAAAAANGLDASSEGIAALENLGGTPNSFVIRIYRYIAMHYLRVLVFALASGYLISALVELRGLMDDLLRTRQPPSLLLTYFKYFTPTVLYVVLPISCLIGAVVAYTLLARSGELTAMKAAGISMRRATIPVLVVTSLLCVLLYLVEDSVAPVSKRLAQETQDKIAGRAPKTYGPSSGGSWGLGPDGSMLYHYVMYDASRQEFQGLTVFKLDKDSPRVLEHTYAQKARWRGKRAELEDGWTRSFGPDGSPTDYETFEGARTVEMEPPAQLVVKEISLSKRGDIAEQMSLADLNNEIKLLKNRGYDTTRLEVAFHAKISRAVSPLVMVLLGLPFAFRVGRRGSLYGIGVALLLVLVYWAVFAVFNALGLETLLDPWAAAWAPNILFGLLGTYLLLYIPT